MHRKKLFRIKNDLEKTYGNSVYVCPADLSVKDAALSVFDFTLENDLKIDDLINEFNEATGLLKKL